MQNQSIVYCENKREEIINDIGMRNKDLFKTSLHTFIHVCICTLFAT